LLVGAVVAVIAVLGKVVIPGSTSKPSKSHVLDRSAPSACSGHSFYPGGWYFFAAARLFLAADLIFRAT